MLRHLLGMTACAGVLLGVVAPAVAAPPEPSGPHPRLFLDADTLAALTAAKDRPGSAVARAVTRCDRIKADPGDFTTGGMGLDFGVNMSACALAWKVTGDDSYAVEAVRFFRALLDDYQRIGDGAGGDDVVRHDTGYAMRGFGPYAALAYDWLRGAPGVDSAMLARARGRFKAWTDWYDGPSGYHNDQPGANYHAGYVFAETMIAIAQGGEAGAEGAELWAHVVDDIFGRDMDAALRDGGALDGGDWLEGWQYGDLSVLEYAASVRALREHGVALVGYAAWEGQLVARTIYASPPGGGEIFIGGDADIETPYRDLPMRALHAALIDAGPDEARGWAQHLIETFDLTETSFLLLAALAEERAPAAIPFPPSSTLLWSPGSHTVYARTGWADDDVWMVTRCLPSLSISDHLFFDAGNLVLSRGADHVIVDPSPYGSFSTLTGNAPTLSSASLPDGYTPAQGPWGSADQVGFAWRRQSNSGVVATRCEYHGQYFFREEPGDVTRAMRDIVMVPSNSLKDATVIVIDYAAGGNGPLLLRWRTLASLTASGNNASVTIGGSRLGIQLADTSASAVGSVRALPEGDCFQGQTRGDCDAARFAGGEWRTSIAGSTKRAVTVLDATSGAPPAATVTDGAGFQVIGAERGGRWIAVVTATTPTADTATTPLTYRTPAGLAATHVVVDAPRGDGGRSDVTASHVGNDCEVTVTPRDGTDGGYDGRPLMLLLTAACAVTEDPDLGPFNPPTGIDPDPNDPGHANEGGCCDAGSSPAQALGLVALAAPLLLRRRSRPL